MNIPTGFGTVFPYLFIDGATAYLDFLQRAFGARLLGCTDGPDGRIANARVRIGSTSFMISEADGRFPVAACAFYLYVEDADAAYTQALAQGATSIMPPMDMPYGDRQGGVWDPAGIIWWITTRLVNTPYDE